MNPGHLTCEASALLLTNTSKLVKRIAKTRKGQTVLDMSKKKDFLVKYRIDYAEALKRCQQEAMQAAIEKISQTFNRSIIMTPRPSSA